MLLAAAGTGDDQVVAAEGQEVFPGDPCGVSASGDAEVVGDPKMWRWTVGLRTFDLVGISG